MNTPRSLTVALAALALGVALPSPAARAQDADHDRHHPTAAAPAATQPAADAQAAAPLGDPYPLNTDPVTGEELSAKPVVVEHDGREFRFASKENAATFEADPKRYIEAVDQKMIDGQLPYYPLTTCPVSGEGLGSMGEPVDVVYGNRLVRFCCNGCVGDFKKDPAPVMAKLDEAVIAKQKEAYPLDTCPISGAKLGTMGEPVDVVVANRLVRLCCDGCESKVRANPAKVLDTIDAAWAKSEATPGASAAGSAVGEPAQTQPAEDGHAGHKH